MRLAQELAIRMYDEITALPYASGRQLEFDTKKVLQGCGFISLSETSPGHPPFELSKDDRKLLKDNTIELMEVTEMYGDHLYFIEQPLSDYAYPDFLLLVCGTPIVLECKSSADHEYKFGHTYPDIDTLHVLSCSSSNRTTMCLGQDMLDPTLGEDLHDYITDKIKSLNKEIRDRFKNDPRNINNWTVVARKQYIQHGGRVITDFVDRAISEGWDRNARKFLVEKFKRAPNMKQFEKLILGDT